MEYHQLTVTFKTTLVSCGGWFPSHLVQFFQESLTFSLQYLHCLFHQHIGGQGTSGLYRNYTPWLLNKWSSPEGTYRWNGPALLTTPHILSNPAVMASNRMILIKAHQRPNLMSQNLTATSVSSGMSHFGIFLTTLVLHHFDDSLGETLGQTCGHFTSDRFSQGYLRQKAIRSSCCICVRCSQ